MEEQPAVDGALSCELIEPAGLLAEIARPCANLSVRFVSVGVLAEVCISRVGCFGANGVGVHELWEYAGAMAGCGGGALDPECLQYLWEGVRSSAEISFVRRQGSARTKKLRETPHLVTDVDHEMIAVASADLAAKSLGLRDPNIALNEIQQKLLEEVAQAGESGAMQNDLTKKLKIDARTIHYNVRHLQGEQLPTALQLLYLMSFVAGPGFGLVKAQKALRSNVVCLSRHYNACLCKLSGSYGAQINVGAARGSATLNYVDMAERVVAALRAARDCTLVEREVRITVGMKGNVHRTAWAMVKRELERRGVVNIRVTVNSRVQPCLHLKSSGGLPTGGPERSPVPMLEGSNINQSVPNPQIRAEETLQQQIYNLVIESGEEGITHTDIKDKLRVPTKLSYSICCALVAAKRLCVVAETIKGQCNYRLIGPVHIRAKKYARPSASAASAAEVNKDGIASAKFPQTVQQRQRRERVLGSVEKHRMIWLPDLLQCMKSEFGDEIDKKVAMRLISELQNEGKVQACFFSTRTSLRHQERQIQAIFAVGVARDGPEMRAFVNARAVKRRKVSGKLEDKPHMHVEVDNLPRAADIRPRKHAALVRLRRLELGFIEGRMARAKALHQYLWAYCATENQLFSMESVLKDMKLRDYAQLLGITTFDLSNIEDYLAKNVKVSSLPEPHCHTFINGQPTFYSFKAMLEVLMKLSLLSPAMNSGRSDAGRSGSTDDGTPMTGPVDVAKQPQASFSHFSLATTVRLPGSANRTTASREYSTESASSKLALGTAAKLGMTSKAPRDRAYFLNRDGELDQFWSDLQSFSTEHSRAGSTQRTDPEPHGSARPNSEDIARQEGLSELPELFRARSWIPGKLLNATQRAEVERALYAADVQPPCDFKTTLQIAKSTKLPLVSLVAHFNNMHQSAEATLTSRLMPIRQRAGASSGARSVSAAVSGGPRKSRRRQSRTRSGNPETASPINAGGLGHAPDHVAAYMATAQAGRRKNTSGNARGAAGNGQARGSAREKVVDDDTSDCIVPRRAAKLHWSSQMDMDLATAYIAERNRVARSDKCYRVSWNNIGVEVNVSADKARRRWAVLQKDSRFNQAITMVATEGASQSSLLQLILQGGTAQPAVANARLPGSMRALQRNYHIRDGRSDVHSVRHINPKLSALMLALKAILLVPENRCERDTAVSLLTRFENCDIEHAIQIMKDLNLLTSAKGAKSSSRAFRLSAKFYESHKLVAERYQRDVFDAMRAASVDITSKLASENDDSTLDDIDPVSGGGHAAVVLGQLIQGTLSLSPKSSLTEDETTIRVDRDTTHSSAPNASILSHLLLVGAVRQSADGRSGSDRANLSVHLPPWKIGMCRVPAAVHRTAGTHQHQMNSTSSHRRDSIIEWCRFKLVDRAHKDAAVDVPNSIFEAALKAGIPRELVNGIFSKIHLSGREGATMEDIVQLLQPIGSPSPSTKTPSVSAASEGLVNFLAAHRCIVRVSAWDHHRYVSSLVDHVWSRPRVSGQDSRSEYQGAVTQSEFPFANALTSWTRIDTGVDAPLLRSLRQAIGALVMKHPGIAEETICMRVENIHPREVLDLLQSMVDERLLRSREQRVLAPRKSLFQSPAWEVVRCYWALPKIHCGVL